MCGIYYPFRTVPTILLMFTSAEEAQNLISLVASIWASSLHFLCYFIVLLFLLLGKTKKQKNKNLNLIHYGLTPLYTIKINLNMPKIIIVLDFK